MASHDKSKLNPGHSLRNLAHDTSSTSRWRRNRSSANLLEQVAQAAPVSTNAVASKPAPKLERTSSKMSLFNLFSKPKVEKARGHTEVGLAIPMQPQQPPKRPVSPPKSSLRHNPPPPVQQVQRIRSSQMLRPMSIKPSSVKRSPNNDHWDPPPLFQAYPQSIKYATVQACVFSPDVLLRTQSQRRQAEMLRERMDSHRDLSATLENGSEHKKLEKTHRRLISNATQHSTPQLTNKVYVLVTSGYVLQYSGDGPFDRLPEKVLKLGKESAAFACDLIPGKHFVLQISQTANEDGTVSIGPKNSLLSRLRLQNSSARKTATSFLLVLESPEEMGSWMSAVRKEIENLGGMKASTESVQESTSIDESTEKKSTEQKTRRYHVKRDPNGVSKLAPIDSPLQSQYFESPKIVASDWEGDRSEKTISITDSSSVHSGRQSTKRRSVEVSSIATTANSHDQVQLDQLRERSRFSFVSTATSVSGTGTRNTSRNSSPAPTSPLKEGFSPAESEPLRSATSLRSFHMNPSSITTRRRSMQPLPITNENSALSADMPSTPQRHSIYGPTSPTLREPGRLEVDAPVTKSATPITRTTNNVRFSTQVQPQSHPQNPARYSTRSSSAPPTRNGTISPPPSEPAPGPPTGRPQSIIGNLPTAANLTTRADRRISATPKPFLRPLPVRPQTQNGDGSVVVPRRFSSLAPSTQGPIPLGLVINRTVTAPPRPPSAAANMTPQSQPTNTFQNTSPSQQLRRPNSVQIRSDHAPFLSSSRPVRAISSTPSFVPGKRASTVPVSSTPSFVPSNRMSSLPAPNIRQTPSLATIRQEGPQPAALKGVLPRRSMPVMGLPPPAPPPNMPLPPPPPVSAPRAVAV